MFGLFFFFFSSRRRHTRSLRDWSSDVCSSDLDVDRADAPARLAQLAEEGASGVRLSPKTRSPGDDPFAIWRAAARLGLARSEERRVGKECRSRGSPYH